MEWRLLRNWKAHALRVTAAEGLSVAWVTLEPALPERCVQRCQSEAESSGAANGWCEVATTKGSPEPNRHVGRSPTY
jgi:hypothetical protein